jgi:hypothetical protein
MFLIVSRTSWWLVGQLSVRSGYPPEFECWYSLRCLIQRIYSLLFSAASHGWATTITSFSRICLDLDIGCRFSLHTRGVSVLVCVCLWCELVREFRYYSLYASHGWATTITSFGRICLDLDIGCRFSLHTRGVSVLVCVCLWCELVREFRYYSFTRRLRQSKIMFLIVSINPFHSSAGWGTHTEW